MICLITIFLDIMRAVCSISVQESQNAAGFLRDGINRVVPRKFAVHAHTKVDDVVDH